MKPIYSSIYGLGMFPCYYFRIQCQLDEGCRCMDSAHDYLWEDLLSMCRVAQYKFLYKMDGITLVEYYCSRHFTEEHKAHIYQ